jgi:hypothetical protein
MCGKAYIRVVEKSGGTTGKSWHDHKEDSERGMRQHSEQQGRNIAEGWESGDYQTKTLRWQPTCLCNSLFQPHPAIVLDPFAGTCTTLRVAEKLRRIGIGLDLGYLDLGKNKIRGNQIELF